MGRVRLRVKYGLTFVVLVGDLRLLNERQGLQVPRLRVGFIFLGSSLLDCSLPFLAFTRN